MYHQTPEMQACIGTCLDAPTYCLAARKSVTSDLKFSLASVGDGRKIMRLGKGAVIFSQGEPATAVYYLSEGKVKITTVSAQGKEAVVAILGSGDFFGEGCLAGQSLRIATSTAITDSTIIRLDKAAVGRDLHEQPAFSGLFVSHLLSRNLRIEADLIDQLFNSSEKRLARLLLLLANFSGDGKPPVVEKLSQETLAQMIGTTRSRVSFFMNKFRRLGFIEYNAGHIEVHSSLLSVGLQEDSRSVGGGEPSGLHE